MSFYPELDNLSLNELIDRFHGPPLEGEEYGLIFFDEVAILIRRQGLPGNTWLITELKKAGELDEERLRALITALNRRPSRKQGIRALSRKDRNWYRKQLLNYLSDSRPFIVAESIDGLKWLGEKSAVDRILVFQNYPLTLVRENVLRYLSSLYPERAFPILIEALKDEHEFVREAAADELASLGKSEAIPFLQQLLDDPNLHVRESAQNAIESINLDLRFPDA